MCSIPPPSPVSDRAVADVLEALHRYTRRVIGFTVTPGVTSDDFAAFLSVVRMDRGSLASAGGVARLVLQAGVHTIKVGEIFLALDGTSQDQAWDGLADLLGGGRLSPEDREIVMDTLRTRPSAIGSLVEKLHAMMGHVVESGSAENQIGRAYHVIKNLDRLILNEPVEDHERLYAHLSARLLFLGEPLRRSTRHR